jgi:hypothetical protein
VFFPDSSKNNLSLYVFLRQVNKKNSEDYTAFVQAEFFYTEQVGVAITPYTWILGDTLTTGILTEDFRDFTQSLQEDSRIIPRLDHNRFLPSPFQFFIQQSSYYTGSVAKWITKNAVLYVFILKRYSPFCFIATQCTCTLVWLTYPHSVTQGSEESNPCLCLLSGLALGSLVATRTVTLLFVHTHTCESWAKSCKLLLQLLCKQRFCLLWTDLICFR